MVAHLGVATPWSFHFGASPVEDLAAAAARRGLTALGMADPGGLWGAVPFQRACAAAGIRPVFGLPLAVEGARVQLIARDTAGWAALCRLATWFQREGPAAAAPGVGRSTRLLRRLEAEWAETARGGDAPFVVVARDPAWLSAARARLPAAALALAVRPGAAAAGDAAAAAELGVVGVALPRAAFADRADHPRHRLLVAVAARRRAEDDLPDALPPSAWLWGARELARAFAAAPRALAAAADLAASCGFRIPLGVRRMPRWSGPRDPRAELRRRCARGRRRRGLTGDAWTPAHAAELRRELALVEEMGLTDYFLIVSDVVAWAEAHGIRCCGRGSAGNSLIAHLLGFTPVDPVRHDLWFDRFLHRGRTDFPDVDLDFAWDERDRVLDACYRRFGRDRVALLGTHVRFGARGAVRELALAHGLPPVEVGRFTRALPWGGPRVLDPEFLRAHPRSARLPLDAEPWRTILRHAAAVAGLPRHVGVHAGGMVLTPGRLTDHLPLQLARRETEDGRLVVTQWEMHAVEAAGLLKIDLLGNRGLAVVRDATRAVARRHGLRLDFARLRPADDLPTRRALARGDTMGCFYVESPSMRSLLRKLRCDDFPTLVAASSVIRPGIASSGMLQAYVARHLHVRRHGRAEDAWFLHPRLRELLGETHGVMAYQEDVLRVAQELAGFDAAEAAALRKAMTHQRVAGGLARWRERFVAGAREHGGLAPETAAELWRQVESFAGYSFCKAHSASYAVLSFESLWLRTHFPAEFMAAVLDHHGGYYATAAYLAEARRMGLELRTPCVQEGDAGFVGHGRVLRVGLREVRGLTTATLERILAARGEGPFVGMDDFVRRVRPRHDELDALVRAGALDALPDGLTRAERMRWTALHAAAEAEPAGGLFPRASVPRPPRCDEFPRRRLLELEEEALGWLVGAHPLELYGEAARRAGVVPARGLRAHVGRRVRLLGWQVARKAVRTRGGEAMLFVSWEDTTALYEGVLFPEAYRRLAPWTEGGAPCVVTGVPRDEQGAITVEVEDLEWLTPIGGAARSVRPTPRAGRDARGGGARTRGSRG